MIIIYKTTCLINNKTYIGQHRIRYPSTLDPWYLGSGKALQAALKKYGIENFRREISYQRVMGRKNYGLSQLWTFNECLCNGNSKEKGRTRILC